MGRCSLLLLLLASLTPGAASPVSPSLRAPSSLPWSTSFRSRPTITPKYSIRYIQQKVDHFGFNIDRTFKQRYLIADNYWKEDGGSILFYTGNEGDIIWFCNNTLGVRKEGVLGLALLAGRAIFLISVLTLLFQPLEES